MSDPLSLVTGGAGFIGANLVRGLLHRGHRVRVIDDVSTGRQENLADIGNDIEMYEGSVLDRSLLERAMKDVSLVFHQAAIPSVARSVERPEVSFQVNAAGTLAVLMASREGSTDRLVYASSSSVYGGIESLPVTESLPTVPVSPYGVSKLAGELMCRSFTRTFGYPTVSLRYFNVFGPRQDPLSEYSAVIPRFIAAMLGGGRPTIFGDGHQTRDFTFVENVVEANLLAAEAGDAAFGQTFNVAQGRRTSLRDLLSKIGPVLGITDINPEWGPERSGDVRHSHADITAAGRVLGYVPRIDLEEGLRRTVEWLAAET